MNDNVVKSVGLRDCKVKLVICTPLAVDGFSSTNLTSYSEYQDHLYTSESQVHLSKREGLVLVVRMLGSISVFLFQSLPSHLANITIPQSADSGTQESDNTEMETICPFWTFQHLMPLSFSHCRY